MLHQFRVALRWIWKAQGTVDLGGLLAYIALEEKELSDMPFPSKKTDELIEQVLSRIAKGETLAALGRELDFHPTVWRDWCREDESLSLAYAQAKETGYDVIADDVLSIIDAEPERLREKDEDGNIIAGRLDNASVTWQKNRAEYRMKLLAKWAPSKYGDSSTLNLGNKDDKPLAIASETAEVTKSIAAAIRAGALGDKDA